MTIFVSYNQQQLSANLGTRCPSTEVRAVPRREMLSEREVPAGASAINEDVHFHLGEEIQGREENWGV